MGTRRASIAVVLTGAAALACAIATAPKWPVNPRFAGCTSDELRVVTRSHRDAARLADEAHAAIESPANRARAEREEWDAYRWWFGAFAPGRYDAVGTLWTETRAEFDHTLSIRCGAETVSCGHAETAGPLGRNRERSAYANYQVRVVQVCPDFFSRSRADQAVVLLHEIARVSSNALDVVESDGELLALAREDPGLAVRNAASLAAFAESVAYGRTPGQRSPSDADLEAAD